VRCDRAENLGAELITELKAFNTNRNQHTSDCTIPRTYYARASNTSNSDLVLLVEIQSIRCALLILIQVGKAISVFLSFSDTRVIC
jgi:hypothetical protein